MSDRHWNVSSTHRAEMHMPVHAVAADPDCVIITPTDNNPVADRTKLKQLNTRIMVYCVYMLDGNLACLGGSSTGSAG